MWTDFKSVLVSLQLWSLGRGQAGEGALILLAKLWPEIPVEEGSSRFTACTTSSAFSAITESKWVNWGKCYLWNSQEFGTSPSPVQLMGLCFLSLLGKYILCRGLGFCRLWFCDIAANQSHLLGSGGKYFTQNTNYLGLNTKLAAVAGPGAAALCVVTPTPINTQCVLWPLCSLPATTSTEKLVVGGGSKALATVGCRPGGRADLSV